MLRSKYGQGMISADKEALDAVLDYAIAELGLDYGSVIECVCDTIASGSYSDALKYNAMYKTSWFRKYIQTCIDVRGGK